MSLRIRSAQLQAGGQVETTPDGYTERLRKYIPTEAVGFWLTVEGMIKTAGDDLPVSKVSVLWFVFVIGLVFTFFWTRQKTQESGKKTAFTHIAISCGAFFVWVFGTGGPLVQSWGFYHPLFGSLLLVIYTVAVSFVIPPEQ